MPRPGFSKVEGVRAEGDLVLLVRELLDAWDERDKWGPLSWHVPACAHSDEIAGCCCGAKALKFAMSALRKELGA